MHDSDAIQKTHEQPQDNKITNQLFTAAFPWPWRKLPTRGHLTPRSRNRSWRPIVDTPPPEQAVTSGDDPSGNDSDDPIVEKCQRQQPALENRLNDVEQAIPRACRKLSSITSRMFSMQHQFQENKHQQTNLEDHNLQGPNTAVMEAINLLLTDVNTILERLYLFLDRRLNRYDPDPKTRSQS